MSKDIMQIRILEDGTIRTITDPISGANHQNAEGFIDMMARLAGGTTTREHRHDGHQHTHTHSHDHTHKHES